MSALFPAAVPAGSRHWIRPSGCLIAVTAIHVLLVALVFRGTAFLPSDQSTSVVPVSVEMIVAERNLQNIATSRPSPAETHDTAKPLPPAASPPATATTSRAQSDPAADIRLGNDARPPPFHTPPIVKTMMPISESDVGFLPPSAVLQYNVQSVQDGKARHGTGRIFWQAGSSTYSVQAEVIVEHSPLLSFTSEGLLDNTQGLKPHIYIEKQREQPPTNTLFLWEKKSAAFTNTKKLHSLHGDEQDQASIIWQLIRMGQKNNAFFAPGKKIRLPVVGAQSAGAWRIHVVGQQDLQTPIGDIKAWHLVIAPDALPEKSSIDVWLAASHNWYPVKLRYTEKDGGILDLSIQEIAPTSDI